MFHRLFFGCWVLAVTVVSAFRPLETPTRFSSMSSVLSYTHPCSRLDAGAKLGDHNGSDDEKDDQHTSHVSVVRLQSRRHVLLSTAAAMVGSGMIIPHVAAAIDPLDVFAQQLQQQQGDVWPQAASPLPRPPSSTIYADKASDSSKSSSSTSSVEDASKGSDLDQALKAAQKKKQVDPRTHG